MPTLLQLDILLLHALATLTAGGIYSPPAVAIMTNAEHIGAFSLHKLLASKLHLSFLSARHVAQVVQPCHMQCSSGKGNNGRARWAWPQVGCGRPQLE